ncbi:LysR family transcriptional regulator [Inquilinus limosus]|uniref:LysR family transcriptional regulator n=1 Tax=Inquilinus limosus TaxID=171674 RepID=UPI00040121C2|nr:LysR family transcriptional regulator [Inquilinus limosus]
MLDALTLDQMRAFVAVADAGSFRAAAVRLARVQSAISHAVANLEAQLGVALFDRSGRRPVLTAEGRALLADMRAILLKTDLLRSRAKGMGEGVELGLSIAVDPLFPEDRLAAALAAMHAAFPSVGVRLWPAPLGAAEAALRDRRCTLALTTAEIADPRIEAEVVLTLPFVAVAAPAHPLAAPGGDRPLSAAALADHLQIVVEDPSALTGGRDFGVLSPGTWRVGDLQAKRALIRAGLGWGRLPGWLVERDLAEGRLVRIPAGALGRGGEEMIAAALAHRVEDPPGPAARRLRDALLQAG